MKEKIIKNYINNLNYSHIKNFALKNNINLAEHEINTIYTIIKNNYTDILNDNYDNSFKLLKNNLTHKNYELVRKLFFEYKNKYQHLL